MSKFRKKKGGDLPAISTASLPDIVFMLLFFFMVTTVMRQNSMKVKQELPVASQLEKLDKKDRIIYIYAGKPSDRYQSTFGQEARLQLGDKFADIKDIKRYIEEERAKKNEQLIPFLTTSLKVDKETNMGLISDIKQELRKVEAYKINYTTRKATEDAQVFDNMN